jgi:NADH dehydrogenase FAD-containing subunit
MQKRIVIVGGGYAGVTLARALDDSFDVLLLERRDLFYHNVGALRAYARPALYDKLFIPYSKLLRRGRVVQDQALVVTESGVTGSSAKYEADITVVATGSRHLLPFKSEWIDSAQFLTEARALSARLAAAASVAILGDGPVGVELAGEIRHQFPEKPITLVSPTGRLLQTATPRLGARIAKMCSEINIRIEPSATAALSIQAYGAAYDVPCLNAASRVPVDEFFRVPGRQNVYAIGDAADCGDPPLSFLARRQAQHLAAALQGNPKPYKPAARVAMSVPLGPQLGATQLPLPGLPVVGSWLTSRLKGKGLFIAENWARLGQS